MQDDFRYALMPESNVYHLLELDTSHTLCGLKTKRDYNSVTLLVISTKPKHGKLCRHCDDALDQVRS